MRQFRFRLETLLRLRQQQEDQKKRAVGELVDLINRQQRQALDMAEAINREGKNLKEQLARGRVDLNWMRYYHSYVTHTQQAIQQRIEVVARVQKQLGAARRELAEAAKQTKILSMLKDKRKQRYDLELRRIETRRLDEISKNIFLRARRTA